MDAKQELLRCCTHVGPSYNKVQPTAGRGDNHKMVTPLSTTKSQEVRGFCGGVHDDRGRSSREARCIHLAWSRCVGGDRSSPCTEAQPNGVRSMVRRV